MSDKKNNRSMVLIGGGGHCKSCIDVIEAEGKFTIAGIVDNTLKVGEKVLGYPVLGNDDDLPEIRKTIAYALITTGQIKTFEIRKKLAVLLHELEFIFPVITSPYAHVSPHSLIGEGSIIMHHSLINADTKIGAHCIINSGAIIEHDCSIGDLVHVSTGCRINGNVHIGNYCFLGSGSIANQGISITDQVVIGSGALVLHSISVEGIYIGQPAKRK